MSAARVGPPRTVVALLATSLALAAIGRPPRDNASWRDSQAEWVQTAVLADLVEEVRSGRADPILVGKPLCVILWSSTHVYASDDSRDPGRSALAQLTALEPLVRPGSLCSGSDRGPVETATGRRAVELSVGRPQWIDGEFARVEGAWLLGPFYAVGFRYTVSFTRGRWAVDTARFDWIS